jgi:hypothetical protein
MANRGTGHVRPRFVTHRRGAPVQLFDSRQDESTSQNFQTKEIKLQFKSSAAAPGREQVEMYANTSRQLPFNPWLGYLLKDI